MVQIAGLPTLTDGISIRFFVASEGSKAVKRRLGYSVNINALNNASASAENVIQELNYYIANRNLDHITNAFNQMEQGFQVSMAYAFRQWAMPLLTPLKGL